MMNRMKLAAAASIGLLLIHQRPAQAVVKAFDSAGDPAYAAAPVGEVAAWRGLNPTVDENPEGDDNGGFGFQPWDFAGGYYPQTYAPQAYGNVNHFIDGVDFPASTFNELGGPAFGIASAYFPANGPTTFATRPFAAPLAVGDTFSVDIDTPKVFDDLDLYLYPFVAILLIDANDEVTFDLSAGDSPNFQAQSGGPFNWSYKTSSTGAGTGTGLSPYATSDGSSFTYKLTGAATATFTFDGQSFDIALAKGAPAAVKFFIYDNAPGDGGNPLDEGANPTGEREFFFDNLKIESASTAIPGDFNNSGGVGAADFALWKTKFGETTGGGADGDGDGDSDGADFLIWQKNFGAGTGGGLGATPTPEPGAALLAIMGLLALWRRQSRVAAPVAEPG